MVRRARPWDRAPAARATSTHLSPRAAVRLRLAASSTPRPTRRYVRAPTSSSLHGDRGTTVSGPSSSPSIAGVSLSYAPAPRRAVDRLFFEWATSSRPDAIVRAGVAWPWPEPGDAVIAGTAGRAAPGRLTVAELHPRDARSQGRRRAAAAAAHASRPAHSSPAMPTGLAHGGADRRAGSAAWDSPCWPAIPRPSNSARAASRYGAQLGARRLFACARRQNLTDQRGRGAPDPAPRRSRPHPGGCRRRARLACPGVRCSSPAGLADRTPS
jgi:hypothetical protein